LLTLQVGDSTDCFLGGFRFSDDQPIWYEEMVLIGCVLEVRNATPIIKEVTDTEIVVDLGCV